MCHGCWVEEGQPVVDTPTVRAAAKAIAEVYEHSCVGGNLHIVLDDWNLEDDSLAFCDGCIKRNGLMDPEHYKRFPNDRREEDSPEQLAAERRCHDLFAAMTVPERASALALYDGFWKVSSPEGLAQKDEP